MEHDMSYEQYKNSGVVIDDVDNSRSKNKKHKNEVYVDQIFF